MGGTLAVYAGNKAIDAAKELFVAYIRFKFMTPPENGQRREITLYGAKGEIYRFKDKKKKG